MRENSCCKGGGGGLGFWGGGLGVQSTKTLGKNTPLLSNHYREIERVRNFRGTETTHVKKGTNPFIGGMELTKEEGKRYLKSGG